MDFERRGLRIASAYLCMACAGIDTGTYIKKGIKTHVCQLKRMFWNITNYVNGINDYGTTVCYANVVQVNTEEFFLNKIFRLIFIEKLEIW